MTLSYLTRILTQLFFLPAFFNIGFSQKDYIISYWPLIYEAETAIIKNEPARALSIYQDAFHSMNNIFAIDLVNAAVCAIKTDSASVAIGLLRKLILKGISEEYLIEFKGFERLRGSPEWNELLHHYDSLRNLVQFNDRLFIQLDSIFKADQEFRIAPGSYAKYGDTIAKIDFANVQFIRNVIQEYGFPNEHILGAERPGINFPGEIILHHHCQSLSLDTSGTKYNFESDFYYAIQRGELDPHRMAQLIALQGKYAPEIGQNTIMQLSRNGAVSGPLRQKTDPNRKSILDENRIISGLESQDAFYSKAVFALMDPQAKDFEFKRYTQSEIFYCDEATYDILITAFEPLRNP